MNSTTISEVIAIAPTYTSEVNIWMDLLDPDVNARKVSGYIPTAPAREAIGKIVQGFLPMSDKRAHLVTGMYGTGKSHFGLVLANLFGRPPSDELLETLMVRLREKDPSLADRVARNRGAIPQKFLVVVVPPTAESGAFNHSLLSALHSALNRENVDYQPQTYYSEAAGIVERWASSSDNGPRLRRLLAELGTDVRRLAMNLRELKVDAYSTFKNVYQAITDTPFYPQGGADPVSVYRDTARHIRRSGQYAGIFVVADEFGMSLRDMARDPNSRESIAIQNFLEFCKRSREDQVHFLVIAHKTLADYATGYLSQADWEKVYGRFIENEYSLNLAGGDVEMVDMIDAVITTRTDTDRSRELRRCIENRLGIVTDWALDARLYPGQSAEWIEQTLVSGCYPLHPASTFCLPWLAQRVGQANRTAFKFLESTEPGGLFGFVREAPPFLGEVLNLYTPDALIGYFGRGAADRSTYHPVMDARAAALSVCGAEPLATRLVNLIAVLEIVDQPVLPPTREVITCILSEHVSRQPEVESLLDTLAQQLVIRYRAGTGRYELPRRGAGEIDVYEAIRRSKSHLRTTLHIATELAQRADLSPIVAHAYEQKYGVRRHAVREMVSPSHLDNLEPYRQRIAEWYSPRRGTYQGDALILYVAAQSQQEIELAKGRIPAGTGSEQLLVAIPRSPFTGGEILLELAAIRHLRALGLKMGDQTVDAEDLDRVERDIVSQADQAVALFQLADNFTWYQGQNVSANIPSGGEESFISGILLKVFNKTPMVQDEALAGATTSPTIQRRYRLQAMQQLLDTDGLIQIMKTGGQANERMLRTALRDTEVLEKRRDVGKWEEYELRSVAPASSSLSEVWNYLRKQVSVADHPIQFSELVSKLLAPPYGMSQQLIEMMLAAAFRTVKDQCVLFENQRRASQAQRPEDLQPVAITAETISKLVLAPDHYVGYYIEVLPAQRQFLQWLISQVDVQHEASDGVGLWERAKNVLVGWFAHLPVATREAQHSDPVVDAVSKLLSDEAKLRDGRQLLAVELPQALGVRVAGAWTEQTNQRLQTAFQPVYEELQNYIQGRALMGIEKLCDVFGTSGRAPSDLDQAARNWYAGLEEYQRLHHFSGNAGHLISAVREPGDVIERFLVTLPKAMSQPAYTDWIETSAVTAFALEVQLAKHQVEAWKPSVTKVPSGPEAEYLVEETARQQIRAILLGSQLPIEIQVRVLTRLLAEIQQ